VSWCINHSRWAHNSWRRIPGWSNDRSRIYILFNCIWPQREPFDLSHDFLSAIESIGALGYVFLGLAGLLFSGFYLYNLGVDIYHIVPTSIQTIFNYSDPTNAGILPYLNFVVGLKVMVGLSAIVYAFLAFREYGEEAVDEPIEEIE
jgi:energy-converting hydrogenase B subunit I